ncbi:arsenate reductase (glutaredoxin) [Flavobacterium zepuense]|uniref:Arsenate reductase (Glutaredoxin) n=1 Tax=Flavobacterium zepuense TaxID=2593302 RepID=A0A552VAG6_9FLAO|nr:arsenate reductase (glutaredoxin) [Flavobacterium zepuense]TRW27464.1 arsenate reductase (glutaredoxin) [Flavobacterium zepuense]
MITIYHNPRCSKSREGLQLLELEGKLFTTVKYLNEPLTKKELTALIAKLNITPIELVRQKESIWIKDYKGKQLSDSEIIDAMLLHPTLIERPIVVNGNKAVIARPAEKIKKIL